MFTQADLDSLESFVQSNSAPVEAEGGSLVARAGKHLANLPSNIIQSLVNSGEAIGELGDPEADPANRWQAPKFFDVAEPTGTGEMVTDVIGAHLAPELIAALLPFGAAAKGAKLLGASELGGSIAGNVAAGAFTGIKEGPEQALHYGLTGGALASIAPLSRMNQMLIGGGIAGGDAAWTYAETGSPEAALIAGGTDLALGVLPGLFNRVKSNGPEAITPDEIIPPTRDRRAPRLEYDTRPGGPIVPEYNERLALPESTAPDSWMRSYQGYEGTGPVMGTEMPRGGDLTFPEAFRLRDRPDRADLPQPGPIIPEGPWWRNSYRGNEEADMHISDNFYPLADIIDPTATPKPDLDEFFRLKNPILQPGEIPTYTPGQELIVQPSVGQRRPQPVPIPPEKVKEIKTKLNSKIFEMEQDMRFAQEEGDHDTAASLRRVIAHMRSNKGSLDQGFIDKGILNFIALHTATTLGGSALGAAANPDDPRSGAIAGALAGLALPGVIAGGLRLNRIKSAGNPLDDIIESGKVVYDGENEVFGKKLHQFTIEDPTLRSHGGTFQVRGEVTPDSFRDAYNNARIRFGDTPIGEPTQMARKPRGLETGAIEIKKQPFRTAFEDSVEVSPEGKVRRVGKTDVAADGFMNLTRFKKASQIQNDELEAYRLAFPEAFVGDEVNVNQLKAGLEQKALLNITDLSHVGEANSLEKAQASLQHAVDTYGKGDDNWASASLILDPDEPVLVVHYPGQVEGKDITTRITPAVGPNKPKIDPEIVKAWNAYLDAYDTQYIDDVEQTARAASARYESYEINPRPLAELQAKGGVDQLLQVPITPENQPIGVIMDFEEGLKLGNYLHSSGHFNGPDSHNILNFTRGYVDEIPGKGKAEVIFESQSDWAQERRKFLKTHPLIESADNLPEGWSWKIEKDSGDRPTKNYFATLQGDNEAQFGRTMIEMGKTPEEAKAKVVAAYNKKVNYEAPKDHPLLNQNKRLGLKARVMKALNERQDGVFLHDGDTVTLTERHDQSAKSIQALSAKQLADTYSTSDLPRLPARRYGEDWKKGTYAYITGSTNRYVRVDKPELNQSMDVALAKEIHSMYQGGKTLPKKGEYYIPQLKGMRQNYDQDYVNILTELTGVKPERISMGEGTHRATPPPYHEYEIKQWVNHGDGPKYEAIHSVPDEAAAKAWIEASYTRKDIEKFAPSVVKIPNPGSKALGGKSDISGWWFDLKPLKDKKLKEWGDQYNKGMNPSVKMRNRMSLMGTRGFLNAHLASTVFGGIIVGEEGYRQSNGDPNAALAGAVIGGAAGYMGYKGLEALLRSNPKLKPSGKVTTDLNRIKSEATEAAKDLFSKPSRDIAGEDTFGRGGVMSKFIKGLEFWGRLHLPDEIKTAWTQARGTGVLAVQTVLNSLDTIKSIKVPEPIRNAANQFMEGKMLPEADAIRSILKGGGVTESVWKAIDPASRPKNFSMWKVGPAGAEKTFYVPNTTKTRLMIEEEDAFKSILGKDHAAYFDFVRTSRRAVDNLQSLFAEALPDGDLKHVILNSVGQYVPRTFRIFTDQGYRPTEPQIKAAMDELKVHLSTKDPKFASAPDQYFRREIENYLHEIQTSKELFGIGSGRKTVDTTMLKEREDLTPTFRELLGEYTDPKDRIIQAVSRLYPSAQAARFISLVRDMKLDGLNASMTKNEWLTTSKALESDLNRIKSSGGSPVAIAAIEAKIRRLGEYVEIPDNLKYGEFKGVLANRFISDQLRGFDGHFQGWDTPIFRSFARVNNWSKVIHTAYSPATIARNYITMPVFMAIGKASPEAAKQAWSILKKKSGPMYNELLENGILTADQVAGEFRMAFEDIFNGHYDSSVVSKMKGVNNKVMEFYRFPDLIVRAATYLEAKSRFSAQLKKPIDHPDVIKAAVTWTDRRTMNYDNIAPSIKVARNLPFFNQFISYSAEMIRLVKNLTVDATKGDLSALAILGVIGGAGTAIQASAEAALSPEDRKAWIKANELAPDYSRTRYKIPLSRDKEGNFRYADITGFIVTDNINQMMRAAYRGDGQALAAVNPIIGWQETPTLKIMAQAIAGRDFRTQRTFRGPSDYGMMVAKELSPSWTPGIGYEWEKAASVGTTNVKTGRSESWTGVLTRNLAGLNLTSVNPSLLEKSATARMKQEIANERAYLNEVMKLKGISDEKRHRAVARYQESVQAIIQDYRQKIQPDSQ